MSSIYLFNISIVLFGILAMVSRVEIIYEVQKDEQRKNKILSLNCEFRSAACLHKNHIHCIYEKTHFMISHSRGTSGNRSTPIGIGGAGGTRGAGVIASTGSSRRVSFNDISSKVDGGRAMTTPYSQYHQILVLH